MHMGRGTLTCGCGSDPVVKTFHNKERVYVGAATNEIKVRIARLANLAVKGEDVVMIIRRHSCCDDNETTIEAYSLKDGMAYFDLKDSEFVTDAETYGKGMYDAEIVIDDCTVDEIEIVKASSFIIAGASEVNDMCSTTGTGYVEPDCETTDPACDECDNDPNLCGCLCEPIHLVKKRNVNDEYLGDMPVIEEDE